MSLKPPTRPLAISAFNALAKHINNWPSLDADSLMAAAIRKARFEDFGDTGFIEPLKRLTDDMNNAAQLHPMGRLMARQHLSGDLARRLAITAWRKHHPQVAEQRIEKPVFIIGLPRTGTTLLFNLLAQDPANRTPLAWEVDSPCPPANSATYYTDPRIKAAQKQFTQLQKLCPELFAIHEMAAHLPQECVALTGMDGMSVQFSTLYDVPNYQRWIDQQSWVRPYEFHKQFLQHLQSGHAATRWVLKSPGNLAPLNDILSVYPDARIIHTHRTPTEVMPSLASLNWTFRGLYSDKLDAHYIGKQVVDLWHEHLDRAMAARADHADEPERFFDMQYRDFVADPLGTIARIYQHFGIEMSAIASQRMKSYLRANPQGKFGRHRYTLEDFGLDRDELNRRFAPYCHCFGV